MFQLKSAVPPDISFSPNRMSTEDENVDEPFTKYLNAQKKSRNQRFKKKLMQIRCNHTLNTDISNKVKMTEEWVGGKAKAPTPCGRDKSMYLLQKTRRENWTNICT